ncbi:UNVERIFIED_CONTAM: MBOAT family protein, partial [Salmonella enterica subsp. enterica serovar Weltevreden]
VDLLAGMAGAHGIGLPETIGLRLGALKPLLLDLGIEFYSGGGDQFVRTWCWVTVAALIALGCPNTQQIHARLRPTIERVRPLRGGLHFS